MATLVAAVSSSAGEKPTRHRKNLPKQVNPWGNAQKAMDRTLGMVSRGERIVELFNSGSATSGDEGAQQLAEALEARAFEGTESVVQLRVQSNGISHAGIARLADALTGQLGLRRLDISGNPFGDAGVAALAEAMRCHPPFPCPLAALESVKFRRCEIGNAGASRLAEVLLQHASLFELDLEGNSIRESGAASLAELVQQHPTLNVLSLSNNAALGDAGTSRLAGALGPQCSLRSLHLAGVGVGDRGVFQLARALDRQPTLQELRLSDNGITDMGASELIKSLEPHPGLRELSLERNKIQDELMYEFLAALARMQRDDITCNLLGNPVTGIRFGDTTLVNLTTAAKTVKRLEHRGVQLVQLLNIYKAFLGPGHFRPDLDTTVDVAHRLIKEETKKCGVCYGDFCHNTPPDNYVVHPWKGLFRDLVRGVAAHASGLASPSLEPDNIFYLKNPKIMARNYFIDVFCCDLATTFPVGDPYCETDKFDLVLAAVRRRSGEVAFVADTEHWNLTRMWCISEAHWALHNDMPLSISFGTLRPLLRRRRKLRGWEEAETTTDEDRRLLNEQLDSRRSVGRDRVDEEVVEELKRRIIVRYKELHSSQSTEVQEELDWMERYDEAAEDIHESMEGTDLEFLQKAINEGILVHMHKDILHPALRYRAELAARVASHGEEIDAITAAIEAGDERVSAAMLTGDLSIIASMKVLHLDEEDAGAPKEGDDGDEAAGQTAGEQGEASEQADYHARRSVIDQAWLERNITNDGLCSIDAALHMAGEALEHAVALCEEEHVPDEQVAPVKEVLEIVNRETRKRKARAALFEAIASEDLDLMRSAYAEAVAAGVDEEALALGKFRLVELELSAAVKGVNADALLKAIEAAKRMGLSAEVIAAAKRALAELNPAMYRVLIEAELIAAIHGSDVEALIFSIEEAVAAEVNSDIIMEGRRKHAELEVARAIQSGSIGQLSAALELAAKVGVKSSAQAARKRLVELELGQAMDGENADALRTAIANCSEIGLEEGPLVRAGRRLKVLELKDLLQTGDIEAIRLGYAAAQEAGVVEEELLTARRAIAEADMNAALEAEDIAGLRAATERCVSAGMSDEAVLLARMAIARDDLTRVSELDIHELRDLIIRAEELIIPDDELKVARKGLALLRATAEDDFEVLKAAITAARRAGVWQQALESGKRALENLDTESYREVIEDELREASEGSDDELLRHAIHAAELAAAEPEVLQPAQLRYAELLIEAAIRLGAAEEMEDHELQLSIATTQRALDVAAQIGFGQQKAPEELEAPADGEDGGARDIQPRASLPCVWLQNLLPENVPVTDDNPEVDAVEAAEAKLDELNHEVHKRKARHKLEAALEEADDLKHLRKALEEATAAGVEEELLAKAQAQLE